MRTKNLIDAAASLALVVLLSGCAASHPKVTTHTAPPSQPAPVTAATPGAPVSAPPDKQNGPAAASLHTTGPSGGTPYYDAFKNLGAEGQFYQQTLAFLCDPALEGRSADVKGNKIAADFLEWHFKQMGLEPAFPVEATSAATPTGSMSYQQPFSVRGDVEVTQAEMSWAYKGNGDASTTVTLKAGEDFNVLGCSGDGDVTGPLEFVGYAIEEGPDGYAGFKKDTDLKGKIAVVLRFEPVTTEGKSKWTNFGRWSQRAGLVEKIKAAVSRGAVGVVLVNPPGADDPRIEKLETAKTTRFGGLPVPVVMATIPAVNKILEHADAEGRSLLKLRTLADEGGVQIALDAHGVQMTLKAKIHQNQLPTQNVGAVLKGKGALASEYLIIGGHYDHVGYGYVGGATPSNIGKLHPGADDNASGATGVVLAAKVLKDQYAKLGDNANARSIMFLDFSGEEMGLLGSDYFVKHTPIAASAIVAMLNMDMIGRLTNNKLEVDGVGTAENFETYLKPMLDKAKFDYTLGQSGRGPSDHATFYGADIPVLHLFTGTHVDYHQPTDTLEKINIEGAVRVVNLMTDIAYQLATTAEKPKFKPTSGGSPAGNIPRANVRLGIAPGDYSGQQPGVLVGEVFEGTSADKAGIKKGDRIIKWGGEELSGVEGMMAHLATHKPGDKVEMVIVRDGKEMTIVVTMLGREPRG